MVLVLPLAAGLPDAWGLALADGLPDASGLALAEGLPDSAGLPEGVGRTEAAGLGVARLGTEEAAAPGVAVALGLELGSVPAGPELQPTVATSRVQARAEPKSELKGRWLEKNLRDGEVVITGSPVCPQHL